MRAHKILICFFLISILLSIPLGYCFERKQTETYHLDVNSVGEDLHGNFSHEIGSEPYLDALEGSNIIQDDKATPPPANASAWWFYFQETNLTGFLRTEILEANLTIAFARLNAFGLGQIVPELNVTNVLYVGEEKNSSSQTYSYQTWNVTSFLNSTEEIDNLSMKVYHIVDSNGGLKVDHAYLSIQAKIFYYVYPLRLILGLLGLALMIASPSIGVREVLKNRNLSMIGGCIIAFAIGYGMVHAWLIP